MDYKAKRKRLLKSSIQRLGYQIKALEFEANALRVLQKERKAQLKDLNSEA